MPDTGSVYRPRLFPLPPLGRGTGRVESLTGYVARLARAHRLQAGRLITEVVRPRVIERRPSEPARRPLRSWETSSLNGSGERSVYWTEALEELTSVAGLAELTVAPWIAIVPPQRLLRQDAAYCPECLADDLRTGEPYERLSWLVSEVDICLIHERELLTVCPHCRRRRPPLTTWSLPGHCPGCGSWLGNNHADQDRASHNYAWRTRMAWLVDAALRDRPNSAASSDSVRHSLACIIDVVADGNRAALARMIGVTPPTVLSWSWGSRATFRILLRAAAVSGSDLTSIFNGEPNVGQFPVLQLPSDIPIERARRADWQAVEGRLRWDDEGRSRCR